MNIALLCVLIIITGETDGFHVENIRASSEIETGQRTFARKLQSFESEDPKEAKTVTWNQILADTLVNRIKVFSFHKMAENERATDIGTSNNLLTNCISQMMHLYKILVYDKFNKPDNKDIISDKDTELSNENKKVSVPNNNGAKDINVRTEIEFPDPKDEVEIFEPKYHGKMCNDCEDSEQNDATKNETSETLETTGIVQPTVTTCPVGLVASEDGGCTDPKSKFILSIPYQCPIGYRRDWLGYCRPQL